MIQTIKLNNFRKAIENLKFVLKEHKTPIIRDAAIKRYELCYELAWKAVQEALKNQGLEIGLSPKNCFKQAFKQGWIEQEQAYAEMVKNRNLTTHTYNEALADEIYQQLAHYLLLFEALFFELEKV